MTSTVTFARRTWLQRALDAVEWAGNALPRPASLFVVLSGVVVLLSALLHATGSSVTHPMTGAAVTPVNLLSVDGLQRLILNLVPNFVNFAPFGPVIVSLLGLSVAEQSGLLGAVVRVVIGATPRRWLTATVVFAGAMMLGMTAMGLYSFQQRARTIGVLARLFAAALLATMVGRRAAPL